MSKQTKMLKSEILKILAKDVSGGSNTRPPFEDAMRPNTFFGGKDVGCEEMQKGKSRSQSSL